MNRATTNLKIVDTERMDIWRDDDDEEVCVSFTGGFNLWFTAEAFDSFLGKIANFRAAEMMGEADVSTEWT